MAVGKTLDDYIRELEEEEQVDSTDIEAKIQAVASLRKAYDLAKAAYDAAAVELVQLMWSAGIKKKELGDVVLSVSEPTEITYDHSLSEALKTHLSDRQWNECFEPQPPKMKLRGINKFLKMGGQVSEIIQQHQVVRPKKPVPSALRFTQAKPQD